MSVVEVEVEVDDLTDEADRSKPLTEAEWYELLAELVRLSYRWAGRSAASIEEANELGEFRESLERYLTVLNAQAALKSANSRF